MQPTRLQRVSTSEGTMNKTQNKSVIWSTEKANQIQSTWEILSMNTDEHRVIIYADRDTHQSDERTWPTNSVVYPHDWDLIRNNDTHVAQHHVQICFQSPGWSFSFSERTLNFKLLFRTALKQPQRSAKSAAKDHHFWILPIGRWEYDDSDLIVWWWSSLVGGLEHVLCFPYIGKTHPNWLLYFSEGFEITNQIRMWDNSCQSPRPCSFIKKMVVSTPSPIFSVWHMIIISWDVPWW